MQCNIFHENINHHFLCMSDFCNLHEHILNMDAQKAMAPRFCFIAFACMIHLQGSEQIAGVWVDADCLRCIYVWS